MSDQQCRKCGELLVHGDLVTANIVTRFVGLKSKIHYALEKPTECYDVEHVNCQFPQGENENEGC